MKVNLLQPLLALIICAICAYTDWRNGKVYNLVTYPAITAGLVLSFFSLDPDPTQSLIGAFGGLLIYGLFWLTGGLGAGDVKLMVAIGALLGLPFLLLSSFYVICIAAIFSIFHLAWKGRLFPFLKWLGLSATSVIFPGVEVPKLAKEQLSTIPFAPFIFVGTAITLFLERFGVNA